MIMMMMMMSRTDGETCEPNINKPNKKKLSRNVINIYFLMITLKFTNSVIHVSSNFEA